MTPHVTCRRATLAHARLLQVAAVETARRDPQLFVMKPQREGGGNNVYGEMVARMLQSYAGAKPRADSAGASASAAGAGDSLAAYILMQRIFPRTSTSVFVRGGHAASASAVSELGVYGVFLGDGTTTHLNAAAGHLLRTKVEGTDEGGVAAGFSVLDSPLLYDE